MDYSQILPNLYLGSCPTTTGDIDRLKQELGITAVLNLQTSEDYEYLRLDWQKLLSHYLLTGIQVRRIPVRDFDEEDLRQKLPDCERALTKLLDDGQTVFLHCTAGTGRSPTVVTAYLHWEQGWPLEEAERHVKARRACMPNLRAIRLAGRDIGRSS